MAERWLMGEENEGKEEEEEQVMSDVHVGNDPRTLSCVAVFSIAEQPPPSLPCINVSAYQTLGSIQGEDGDENLTNQHVVVDEMGDLVLARRKRSRLCDVSDEKDVILVHHQLTTSIPCVGLQVWRGALLLSDFLVHKMRTTDELDNVTAVELGAGTGLVGIVLAQKARLVYLTDRGMDILDNCYRNAILNLHRYQRDEETIRVRELDWHGLWPPVMTRMEPHGGCSEHQHPYVWTKSDLEEMNEASLLLAADVIYSNELTDAFFSTVQHLMPPGSKTVLLLALEKRFNFTIDDLDVVAHGYAHFQTFIKGSSKQGSQHGCEQNNQSCQYFFGKQLEVDQIPQYIGQYERTSNLELWEIHSL